MALTLYRRISLVVVRGTTAAVSPSMTTPEAVVLADHSGGLARVDHPGVGLLAGDHEPAPAGDPPLHGDGPARLWRPGPGAVSAAQPGPAVHPDRAGQGAQQRPIVAQDSHQRSFHAHGDPLPSQRQPHANLLVAQADQAGGVEQRDRPDERRARLPPAGRHHPVQDRVREYPPGAPLPSAKSMSQEYGISAGAVTRAVDVIRAEGLARKCQAVASGCSPAPKSLPDSQRSAHPHRRWHPSGSLGRACPGHVLAVRPG